MTFLNVGNVDAVARDLFAIDFDLEISKAAHFFDIDIGSAAHFPENARDRVGLLFQHIQIFAENLDADGGL